MERLVFYTDEHEYYADVSYSTEHGWILDMLISRGGAISTGGKSLDEAAAEFASELEKYEAKVEPYHGT